MINASIRGTPVARYVPIWAAVISAIIFGNLFAFYSQSKEGPIAINENLIPGLIKQKDGSGTIPYMSTGPTFSSFEYGCHNLYTPTYNCLILDYDGKPGVVELRIASYLLKDFPWIRSVEVFSQKQISFQRTEQDTVQSTFRIDVPSNHKTITLIGGPEMPRWADYVVYALMFSCVMFFVSMFFIFFISKLLERAKLKSKNRVT